MGCYVDVAECRRLFYMHVEQGLGWSAHLESLKMFEGEFEDMRIWFCWVNGELQNVNFYMCYPVVCQ